MNFELQSPETKDIAASLAKAQGSIENALKDSKNPHFKSAFASLAAVINATSEELSKNGLSVVQSTVPFGEKGIMVVTTLHHSSGQWFRSYTPLLLSKQDMQGLGGAITYARRYALSAIVGITQADDDGNAASGNGKVSDFSNEKYAENFQDPREAASQDAGDYVVRAGKKYAGQKLKSIPVEDISSFMAWIKTKADPSFRDSDAAKEFLFFADLYLRQPKTLKEAVGDDSAYDFAKAGR
jgi:hypothetical protein